MLGPCDGDSRPRLDFLALDRVDEIVDVTTNVVTLGAGHAEYHDLIAESDSRYLPDLRNLHQSCVRYHDGIAIRALHFDADPHFPALA